MSEKKHRSFREVLAGLPRLKPLLSPDQSHRLFLRRRNSRASITPSVSTGLLILGLELPTAASDNSDTDLVSRRRKKDRHSAFSHLHSSHHSLRRFFKIFRLDASHESHHRQPMPVLPLLLALQLATKYDLGRLIGLGALGSVNLVADKHDALKIYAVKKFRDRLKGESDHDYQTKVRNEFLIGDYLQHQNLVHTMELIREEGPHYYIVMEYCPFDFFNLVMLGLLTKNEIYCYTKQIVNGVGHLHGAGVAHRDLKLDNCVVDSNGVLKLIDFGLAFQFRKAIDKDTPMSRSSSSVATSKISTLSANGEPVMLDSSHRLALAKGIVGLDPYLLPEVFEPDPYDARLADVWSIAIIFCCMVLKRFPWKVPRLADPSFRAFAGLNSMDEPVTDEEKLVKATSDISLGDDQVPKYGPERLLRALPSHSRPLIAGMLDLDPAKRFLINDVINHPFMQSIEICHYDNFHSRTADDPDPNNMGPHPDFGGADAVFVASRNHTHHLVTEKELEQINAERDRARKVKEAGM